jgi:hypothetical protein
MPAFLEGSHPDSGNYLGNPSSRQTRSARKSQSRSARPFHTDIFHDEIPQPLAQAAEQNPMTLLNSKPGVPLPADLPPMDVLILERPSVWLGKQLEWLKGEMPPIVFIQEFRHHADQRRVFLFGAKYDVSEVLAAGRSYGHGCFVEYFAVTKTDEWRAHRLIQRGGSVTYSESGEKNDHLMAASTLIPKNLGSPRWKPTTAFWPTTGGSPMAFIGQASIEENSVTRSHLTWDETIFLFWSGANGNDCYKIVEQDGTQTEDEHYLHEIENSLTRKNTKGRPRKN